MGRNLYIRIMTGVIWRAILCFVKIGAMLCFPSEKHIPPDYQLVADLPATIQHTNHLETPLVFEYVLKMREQWGFCSMPASLVGDLCKFGEKLMT